MEGVKKRHTITDNGDAYIIIFPTMAILPTISDRTLVEWATVRTRADKTPRNTSSPAMISSILILCLRSQYIRKSSRYAVSINKPVPLIVMTKKLWGWTTGSPYNTHTPQFIKVARYGTGENCSTVLFFTIWMNVGLRILFGFWSKLEFVWLLVKINICTLLLVGFL